MSSKLKSPPNYYAKAADPPPIQEGSPLPLELESADFQLCQLCNIVYRKEHFALHQQANHPPDNPEDPPPNSNCPLCPSSSSSKKTFENPRLLFFHFLKYHLPDNLCKFFSQADKAKQMISKPSASLELEEAKKQGRGRKGEGYRYKGVHCPECGKFLAGDLKRHLALVHDKGTTPMISYGCPVDKCKVRRNAVAGIRKHLYEAHLNLWREKIGRWFEGDGGDLKCGGCGWRGGDKWECMVHFILGHSNKLEEEGNLNLKVDCPVCGELGGNREGMKRHLKYIHGGRGLGEWRCPLGEECGGGGGLVLDQKDFEEHWRKMHGGSREQVLLREQGKLIRRVKAAGKVRKLFENKVCFVRLEKS